MDVNKKILSKEEKDKITIDSFQYLEEKDGIYLKNNKLEAKFSIFNSSLLRIRYKSGPYWERDFSYALDPSKVLLHDLNAFQVEDAHSTFFIVTSKLRIKVDKLSLLLSVDDNNQVVLSNDQMLDYNINYEEGSCEITYRKELLQGEHIYGLGDKSCAADLRGKKTEIWGTDNYGFESWSDPLYKNIPFYISLHSNQSYGVFLDNTYRMHYDIGNTNHDQLSIKIAGGELNYYFIYGPDMMEVTKQYTLLTGVPELPPLWALGYQQSKWSYYPAANVYEIANKLRTHRIPCDVIYLDIDYMDGFRCFTWDKERFPDPKQLVEDLKSQGFKTVVIVDPGIKIDEHYFVYKKAMKEKYFVKGGEGGYVEGKVWPGACYFPDFTDPRVREWWQGLFEEMISELGINGVWNDMNEPALFDVPNKSFPNTARHNYEGEESSHRRVHNVYGMQMTRSTYEGVRRYTDRRPFILTRSTYAGGQRYSAGWTGDNKASWEHISIANIQTQRLSICGYSYVGADIGGFIDQPSAELFTRWMAAAILHPFFRNHSSGDHGNQEPWAFDEVTLERVRSFIELRYQFLPLIYTMFYKYVQDGTPMLIPAYMYDQADMHTHYRSDEVLLGNDILFAPVYVEAATQKLIYLPKGNWYNYYSNSYYVGNKEYLIPAPIDQACLFVKGGSILPLYPVMNYTGETKIEQLSIKLYYEYGDHSGLFLYEDKGDGYEYLDGDCNEVSYAIMMSSSGIKLSQKRLGRYIPEYSTYSIEIIGLPSSIKLVNVDNKVIGHKDGRFICHFDFEEINIILA
jgi:alpha-glucosidase